MAKKTSLLEDPIFQTLVAAIAGMMAKLGGLKDAGLFKEAYNEIDKSLHELVGLKLNQLSQLSDAFILELLTVNDFLDVERLWYVSELIQAGGEIQMLQGRQSEGEASLIRSLNFLIEVAFAVTENIPELYQRMDKLFVMLKDVLPEETLFSLNDFYEQRGEYAKAAQAIERMSEISENYQEVQVEKRAFYLRLQGKSDGELSQGGMVRSEVVKALAGS